MNDLSDNLIRANSILFADDTAIYVHKSHLKKLYENMTLELLTLTDWFNAKKLSLYVSKTQY